MEEHHKIVAIENGIAKTEKLLVKKHANIDVASKVWFIAFVGKKPTIHGWLQCEVVNIH